MALDRQPGDPVVGPHGRPVPPGGGSHPGLLRDRHPALRPDGRRDRGLRRRLAPATRPAGVPDPARAGPGRGRASSACSGSRPARPAGSPPTSCSRAASFSARGWPALVVADARLVEPGWFSRALAWHPLHFIGTISYGIYLWHWPVIVYLNGARTGPVDLAARPAAHRGHAGGVDGELLPGRAARSARPTSRGWVRWWGAPLAGVVSAVVIVVATIPAVADPSRVVGTTHLSTTRRPVRARLRRLPRPAADPPHDDAVAGRSAARHGPRGLGHARRLLRDHARRSRRPARPPSPPAPSTASA